MTHSVRFDYFVRHGSAEFQCGPYFWLLQAIERKRPKIEKNDPKYDNGNRPEYFHHWNAVTLHLQWWRSDPVFQVICDRQCWGSPRSLPCVYGSLYCITKKNGIWIIHLRLCWNTPIHPTCCLFYLPVLIYDVNMCTEFYSLRNFVACTLFRFAEIVSWISHEMFRNWLLVKEYFHRRYMFQGPGIHTATSRCTSFHAAWTSYPHYPIHVDQLIRTLYEVSIHFWISQ